MVHTHTCPTRRSAFLLGALLVVGNTVRLDLQSRREEISVLQLLGATDGFIRRPFLYLGAWYGIGAGAIALGLLSTAGHALREPLAQLAASSGSRFELTGARKSVVLGKSVSVRVGLGARSILKQKQRV